MSNKNEKPTVAQAFALLGVALGITKTQETQVVSMELSTADGSTLTVERESGDVEVGDSASPDGEHLMPNGTVIVVTEGVITEIRENAETNEELEQANARIKELEGEVALLNANALLKDEEIKTKAKTQKETDILNTVNKLGGIDVLKTAVSKYKPESRNFQSITTEEPLNGIEKQRAEMKARAEARKNKGNNTK